MNKCRNCNKQIPNRIIIDGKQRVLNSRKYCLECSPFGKHNTKPFGYVRMTPNGRICSVCGKNYKTKGVVCGPCNSNFRRFEKKKKAVEYLGGKCIKCGYNTCIAALTFHHRNPEEKEFEIGGNHCISDERIKKELDKCDLICQNCHSQLHWEENSHLRELVIKKFQWLRGRKRN